MASQHNALVASQHNAPTASAANARRLSQQNAPMADLVNAPRASQHHTPMVNPPNAPRPSQHHAPMATAASAAFTSAAGEHASAEAGGGSLRRRSLVGVVPVAAVLGAAVLAPALLAPRGSRAQGADPKQPVTDLYAALQTVMRMGSAAPFKQRFDRLAPVIDRDFDLEAILRTSVGLRWPALDENSRQTLAAVFRAFTIASYIANFGKDNGQKLEVLPQTRTANGDTVVQSRLVPANGDPVRIDYVMHGGPAGWRITDVLLDGTISRVAVQRSDFRSLLASGDPTPLINSLRQKVADLSGGAMRV